MWGRANATARVFRVSAEWRVWLTSFGLRDVRGYAWRRRAIRA